MVDKLTNDEITIGEPDNPGFVYDKASETFHNLLVKGRNYNLESIGISNYLGSAIAWLNDPEFAELEPNSNSTVQVDAAESESFTRNITLSTLALVDFGLNCPLLNCSVKPLDFTQIDPTGKEVDGFGVQFIRDKVSYMLCIYWGYAGKVSPITEGRNPSNPDGVKKLLEEFKKRYSQDLNIEENPNQTKELVRCIQVAVKKLGPTRLSA